MSQANHTIAPTRQKDSFRRSLRVQILSIAVIGTLGFFVFLAVTLTETKNRADLLKQIRDVSYPAQENLLAALHGLEFIDNEIKQAIVSSDISSLDNSMRLSGQFRANMHNAMMLEQTRAPHLHDILTNFDAYYRDAYTLAQAVVSGHKSFANITFEKHLVTRQFTSVSQALSNLQIEQGKALVANVDAATIRASESLRVGLQTGLLTAALLFLTALITTRGIVQRINNMVTSLRQIATGTGDMTVRIPLTGSDEMTELAYWFNTFTEKLQNLTIESTAEIKRLAYTDTLTSLPNRRMYLLCLNEEIQRLKNTSDKSLAVLFLDLDNFKPINDQLGHDAGDELIRVVARRLLETVRISDTVSSNKVHSEHEPGQAVVARLAGDEFMLVISDLETPEQAEVIAQRIRQAVTQTITINGVECAVGVSIGICMYPDNAQDANELVTCADLAMYEAKNSGKNTYRFFSPELKEANDKKQQFGNAIKSAIEKEEFHLLFQPKFRLKDRQLVGAEALLRWENKELGTFRPAEFIAQAEANGKISEIDDWVLGAVIDQLASWESNGLQPVEVALNFSAFQAGRPNLGHAMEQLAGDRQHLMRQLEIEITETSAIENIIAVENNIAELKQRGIKIAMDDFGAGHSSLTLLTRCPIDTLKLDKEVTKEIRNDEKSRIIVQALIDLATKLQVSVCAEGIEDEEQAQALSAMNCDFGQGYHFSEPLTVAQFTTILEIHNRGLDQAA